VKQEAESIRNTLAFVPRPFLQEKIDTFLDLPLLLKVNILKGAGRGELVLGVDEEVLGKRVLVGLARLLVINHLVEEVEIVAQLIQHAAFIILVAGVHELLQGLDRVVVAEDLELDVLDIPVIYFHVREFEVDILIQSH
jgi:hypothetical protein